MVNEIERIEEWRNGRTEKWMDKMMDICTLKELGKLKDERMDELNCRKWNDSRMTGQVQSHNNQL